MKQGVFYGVGVGPGDPELLTLKAVNIIKECDVVALAVSSPEIMDVIYESQGIVSQHAMYQDNCVAFQIILPVLPEAADKAKLYLPMPMIKDKQRLIEIHDRCAEKTKELLMKGLNIAFITLGDPSVYSTGLYVHKRLKKNGFETKLVPGIPSFCAAAARLDIGLAENKEELHIIPASYGIEESLMLPGTKVLMKAGRKMPYVKQMVKEKGLQVQMVENCGMADEKIYSTVDDIPDESSYYSLMILKEDA